MFTKAFATEVAQLGIIVNGVAPGLRATGLTTRQAKQFMDAFIKHSALKRLCTPNDVAPAVAFLASDLCSYMVGQFLRLSA
jgi:3-oxoacyl-[acyl-carrier protein] reductase